MSFVEKAVIMDGEEMQRAIMRIAHEIIEANKGTRNLVLLGIQRRGVPLASSTRMLTDDGADHTPGSRRRASCGMIATSSHKR